MSLFRTTLAATLASTSMLAIASQAAIAQDQDEADIEIEELVVTGSYLAGKSQFNSASPISVVGADDFKNIGAANFADLVQTLTINNGAQNNPDAFTQNGTTGTSNFNLRGLGVSSTLVLLNNKRQVLSASLTNDGVNFVDLSSLVPNIAVQRIEIVKDGAAALYGSDAVAGVVNFITDDNFEGVQVNARYSTLTDEGSQDDLLLEAKWGGQFGGLNLMAAISYYDRTPLTTEERRLSTRFGPDASVLGNPGSFFVPSIAGGTAPVIDPTGCSQFGGQEQVLVPGTPIGFCRFDFGDFFNLVPDEERKQAYFTASYDVSDAARFRFEAAYADNETIRGNSPTFPFLQLSNAVVPVNNPGNVFGEPVVFFGRAIGNGGAVSPNLTKSETLRLSGSVKGDLEFFSYDVSMTYARNDFNILTEDTVTDNFQAALNGFGGNSCTGTTPGANGCEFYNPFATSFGPIPNSQDVLDFIIGTQRIRSESELFVFDAVATMDVAELPAGNVGLAVGFQLRDETFGRNLDRIANRDGFAFLIGDRDFAAERRPWAAFAETLVPLADGLEFRGSVRYEDYGGSIGSTIDPKFSLLARPANNLTMRASYSTSFRAPSIFQQFGASTSLENIADPVTGGSAFAGVRLRTPTTLAGRDLENEESEAINIGLTYEPIDGLSVSLDFFNYAFRNAIVTTNFQAIVDADPTGPAVQRSPAGTILFVFNDFVNADSIDTNGFDLDIRYAMDTDFGTITPFFNGTLVSKYQLFDPTLNVEINGAGNRNRSNIGSPTPEIRFNTGFLFANDYNNLAVYLRYIDAYDNDEPAGPAQVGSHTTLDAKYTFSFGNFNEDLSDFAASIGVINAFDNAPPLLNTSGGFDSRTHDPRGRVIYFELTTRF